MKTNIQGSYELWKRSTQEWLYPCQCFFC